MTSLSKTTVARCWWLALAFVCWAPAGATPVVDRVSPAVGQVGNVVMLVGSGLAGTHLEVSFGRAPALDLHSPGESDRVARLLVPNKVDPRDPDTVLVDVRVDGVEAATPPGGLSFTYSIPQPSPGVTDFSTGDPSSPKVVSIGQPFVVTLSGSNFMLARRVPQRCLALGSDREEAEVLADSSSDTSVSCFFPGLGMPGDYELEIAFSDGSGASILAPGFVRERRIFGSPPTIEGVSFEANPQQAIRCDFANVVEGYLCDLGLPGIKADPGVFIDGTFTHVRFEARVTDPDSTPAQSNVLLTSASFINPDTQMETTLVLFDDGSFNVFPRLQKGNLPEDCTDEGFGVCTCNPKTYGVRSGDSLANDTVFTRDLAFLDRSFVPSGLLQDCILQQYRDVPIDFVTGSTLEFRVEAVDRQGNLAAWPSRTSVTVGAGSYSCNGDECGCCLLTSGDPTTECKGKPGMISVDFPSGICISLL
jgi:hypothetical protein